MDNKDEFAFLLKIIERQTFTMSLLMSQVSDCVALIQSQIKACVDCNKNPGTVRYTLNSYVHCDRCAAEAIIKKQKETKHPDYDVKNEKQVYNDVHFMTDTNWVDIKNADKIRRLQEFIDLLKSRNSIEISDIDLQ